MKTIPRDVRVVLLCVVAIAGRSAWLALDESVSWAESGRELLEPQKVTLPAAAGVETIELTHGDLRVVFRDNSQSPGVLSGIDSLFNTRAAPEFDAFDPDARGASAGLNFEHVISGHHSPFNSFTPRQGRYTLHKLTDNDPEPSVMLVRRREDCPWDISSTLRYTLRAPDAIDFEFRATPWSSKAFGSRGYAIFFFANYMNDVADPALHFRGIDAPGGEERWIRAEAPRGGADWNGGGTYGHRDAAALQYDDDLEFRLNSWSYDYPRFALPFYYGRAANGMTAILMFDRAWTETDEIRFSLFKFKLPKRPRPAWDFQYVIHHIEAGKEYGFRGRLVWKRWVSEEDCLAEYQRWQQGLNHRP